MRVHHLSEGAESLLLFCLLFHVLPNVVENGHSFLCSVFSLEEEKVLLEQ